MSKLSKTSNQRGFTLIEIVIVLAIAALILVGILLAVQGTQRSRRDAQRKSDAATIGADLEQSASNNGGAYPATAGGQSNANFQTDYVDKITTPDGTTYTATHAGAYGTCPAGVGALAVDAVHYSYNGRQWMVAVGLETGDAYCATSG